MQAAADTDSLHPRATQLPLLVKLVALLVPLGLLLLTTGCTTVGKFYTNRIRPASYYVDRYCFELPKAKLAPVVGWLLKRYHFPVTEADPSKGVFRTKPVHMSRYSRNPNWGYVIGLTIKIKEHHGKLKLKHLPDWALRGKQPRLPPYPRRSDFKTLALYHKAQNEYAKQQERLVSLSAMGHEIMNKWAGCRVRKATLRTIVEVKADIMAHPIGGMGTLDRTQGCKVKSPRSLEHAVIRVIAWRLKRLSFVPVMQYDRVPRYYRGSVCKALKKTSPPKARR